MHCACVLKLGMPVKPNDRIMVIQHSFLQYLTAASFEPFVNRGNAADLRKRLFIPFCKFEGLIGSTSDLCTRSAKEIPTPLGKCVTINAEHEFGKVFHVGDRHGIAIAIDQGPLEGRDKHFKEEILEDVWVGD